MPFLNSTHYSFLQLRRMIGGMLWSRYHLINSDWNERGKSWKSSRICTAMYCLILHFIPGILCLGFTQNSLGLGPVILSSFFLPVVLRMNLIRSQLRWNRECWLWYNYHLLSIINISYYSSKHFKSVQITGCVVCLKRMDVISILTTEQVNKIISQIPMVKSASLLGRPVILSSRALKQGKYLWSAGIVININSSFTWRFLGH